MGWHGRCWAGWPGCVAASWREGNVGAAASEQAGAMPQLVVSGPKRGAGEQTGATQQLAAEAAE